MADRFQVRLQTLFLAILCFSVGLYFIRGDWSTDSNAPHDILLQIFYLLYLVSLATVSVAISIGLIQQTLALKNVASQAEDLSRDERLAGFFAIAWRVLVVAYLLIYVIASRSLIQQLVAEDQQSTDLLYRWGSSLPTVLWQLCLIGVLLTYVQEQSELRPRSRLCSILAWVCCPLLLMLLVRGEGLTTYLVHIACAGINRALPLQFQRPGTYSSATGNHFLLFWISALGCVLSIINLLLLWLACNSQSWKRLLCIVSMIGGLFLSFGYVYWLTRYELPRVSPDLASAPLMLQNLGPLTMAFAAVIVASLITVYTYLLYRRQSFAEKPSLKWRSEGQRFFHEHWPWPLAIGFSTTLYMMMSVVFDNYSTGFWSFPNTALENLFIMLAYNSTFYLDFALAIAGFSATVAVLKKVRPGFFSTLLPLNMQHFAITWLALAAVSLTGLCAFAIFSFMFWLGPWYLMPWP